MAITDRFIPGGIGIDGLSSWIEYNQGNRRIQSAHWDTTQATKNIRVDVWVDDQLVINTLPAGEIGSVNIPGNYQLVENAEGDLDFPNNIKFMFKVE